MTYSRRMKCCTTFLHRYSVTVEPLLFLYMMAIFFEFSVFQHLLYTKICVKETGNVNLCLHNFGAVDNQTLQRIEADTTKWGRYHQAVMSATSLLACLYIGSWSDKFGRKFPMLIPPLGSVVASVSTVVSASLIHLNIGYILISSFFSGICGGSAAFIANCFGYLADISSEEKRTKRLTILESMLFIGGTVGFYVAGFFTDRVKLPYIFICILLIHALIICYTCFILHDVKPQKKDAEGEPEKIQEETNNFKFQELFKLEHFLGILVTVFRPRENGKRSIILILMTTSFLLFLGIAVQSSLVFLYVKNKPLQWKSSLYDYYSGQVFALQGTGLIVVMSLMNWKYKIPDTWLGIIGITSRVLGLLLLGISTTTAMMFSCAIAFTCSELCLPAIRSMLSKVVDCDEKGKILSFMTMLQTLSFLIGALVFNTLYLATMNFFPGFTFELVAVFQAIAMGLFLFLHVRIKKAESLPERSLISFGSSSISVNESMAEADGHIVPT